MYSNSDFEKVCFLYKSEGEPKGISIVNVLFPALTMICEQARFFLEKMGRLYKLEDDYRKENLTPEEVLSRRNGTETTSIIESMRSEMFDLLAQSKETLSDLMNKALNYLHTFGKQLFAYRTMVNIR